MARAHARRYHGGRVCAHAWRASASFASKAYRIAACAAELARLLRDSKASILLNEHIESASLMQCAPTMTRYAITPRSSNITMDEP
jgi:hypothetical protein